MLGAPIFLECLSDSFLVWRVKSPPLLCYTTSAMETKILNYRIIIEPDKQTGTGKPGFTAFCPTLGVADDGDTVEEAIQHVRGAMKAYVESLIADKQPVPIDRPERDIVTTTQINVRRNFQIAS